jgi:hypothetical protein
MIRLDFVTTHSTGLGTDNHYRQSRVYIIPDLLKTL